MRRLTGSISDFKASQKTSLRDFVTFTYGVIFFYLL